MINIAVFASGSGSNARVIMTYFQHHPVIKVKLVVTNRPDAGVINIAKSFGINVIVINRKEFYESDHFIKKLQSGNIDFLILAGFLWLIPLELIKLFSDKIINIHPSLLPKYGGKGMYGHFVHEAVKQHEETETGMTIHLVNEKYDEGKILFQAKCKLTPEMDSENIAAKVLKLEHKYYSRIIEKYILNI